MEKVEAKFKPSFDEICDFFNAIIDFMVISVSELPRIEHLLFEAVEDLDVTFIKNVQLEEILVLDAKERIKTVVFANSHGPTRYHLTVFLQKCLLFLQLLNSPNFTC